MAIAAAQAPATASSACAPTHLSACADTNKLVWSPAFKHELAAFLRGMRGSYLDHNGPVIDQAMEVLHGPPDAPKRLADGSWLFTACRAHSCTEKGAVALSGAGRIRAFGILSFNCRPVPPGQPRCDTGPTLTLFMPRTYGGRTSVYTQAIVGWARNGAAADRKSLGDNLQAPFRGVVTRLVSGRPLARSTLPPRPPLGGAGRCSADLFCKAAMTASGIQRLSNERLQRGR